MKVAGVRARRALAVAALAAATPALALDPAPPSPAAAFLAAADQGDEAAILALAGLKSLPPVLKGCYLRRVYAAPAGEMLAAWMCADGDTASRVVIGSVMSVGEKVKFAIARETRNKAPAPPRTGPALAPEGRP